VDDLQRESFVFFRTFREAIDMIPERLQLAAFKAVCDFALDGAEPTGEFAGTMFWKLVRPILNKSRVRALSGHAGAGPRPSMIGNQNAAKSKNKTKTKQKQNKRHLTLPYLTSDDAKSDGTEHKKGELKPMTDDPMSHAPASAPASREPDPPPVPSAIGPSDHRSSVFIHPSSFGDPVDYALSVSREPVTKYARRCYGAYLRDLGKEAFVDTVERFAAEVRAGEIPHSLPAALNARLKAALEIRQSIAAASSGT